MLLFVLPKPWESLLDLQFLRTFSTSGWEIPLLSVKDKCSGVLLHTEKEIA